MEGNEIKTIEKKSSKKTAIIITIMAIIILCLGGFIIYDKLFLEKQKELEHTDNTTTMTTTTQTIPENKELTKDDKIKYNTEINDKLHMTLREYTNFEMNGFNANKKYINTDLEKVKFTFYYMQHNRLYDNNEETNNYYFDEDGIKVYLDEEGIGAFNIDNFKNIYKKLFNEDINLEKTLGKNITILGDKIYENIESSPNKILLANNCVYSSIVTGWGDDFFILKAKSLTYNNANNTYEFTMDLLSKGTIDNEEYVDLSQYSDPSILEYPEDLIYAQAKLTLEKIDNRYIIKSLTFEK